MDRTYLYVPPEERAEVEQLGAHWDNASKCWYIDSTADRARFAKWLPDAFEDEELNIASDQAYVASAIVSCSNCGSSIEVICVYCESGTVTGERVTHFTVQRVWDMDDGLADQLGEWPFFRRMEGDQEFANHCPHCGAVQESLSLHSEPGDPFFDIPHAKRGAIKLTRLRGEIRLGGDDSFEPVDGDSCGSV